MKKGQSILGDVFVAMFFLIIVIALIWIFFEHMPLQISNIKEQKACAEAETMSKFLFEVNETDIALRPFTINYSSFHNKTYNDTLNETGAKASFKIRYSIYAFNNDMRDNVPLIVPNETYPNVYLLRNGTNIIIRGGSNTTNISFFFKLLFPLITLDGVQTTSGAGFDIKQNYTEPNNKNTSEINVYADITGGDPSNYEEINISLKEEPSVVYLQEATCIGGDCQIYIGNNESILHGEKGPGSIYRQMNYCTIQRRGVIERDNDTYSADLEVIAW